MLRAMPEYLSETEFEALQASRAEGTAVVTMPREVARRFFLRITSAEVKATTGRSIVLQKLIVWLFTLSSPAVFAASLIFFTLTHSALEASLIIPIAGICWIIIYGMTAEQGGWSLGTAALIIAASPLVNQPFSIADPVFLYVLSIWLQRASYLLSEQWLMSIVMGHYSAFEMMETHLQIETD